ncbi:MAG: DivIVA domain-containing protein [Desulfuromonadaceae bacterium]|nr:DivIVA domain-containing protein [Desulfuromonadaceae bacterium]MDD5104114.1 DivIVA domain-containing protein [Desulfuromonadaceae bacterium]
MNISPLDIQQQQFKVKTFRGLDPDDVDAFLQSVAGEMEGLLRENGQLKELQSRQNHDLLEMAEKERELRETLLSAQRVIEEMKANARKEAELIISEAELKGERIVVDAERRLAELKTQIEEIRRQKIQFEMSFKGLLDSFSRQLSGDEPS